MIFWSCTTIRESNECGVARPLAKAMNLSGVNNKLNGVANSESNESSEKVYSCNIIDKVRRFIPRMREEIIQGRQMLANENALHFKYDYDLSKFFCQIVVLQRTCNSGKFHNFSKN